MTKLDDYKILVVDPDSNVIRELRLRDYPGFRSLENSANGENLMIDIEDVVLSDLAERDLDAVESNIQSAQDAGGQPEPETEIEIKRDICTEEVPARDKSTMMDIVAPQIVELQIANDHPTGPKVWINVDGICRLRACQIGKVLIDDNRRSKTYSSPKKSKKGKL